MRRLACALTGAIVLSAAFAVPASADEPDISYRPAPSVRHHTRHRTRTIVRRVVVERPVRVYRTRRVVREVVVERPVYVRPRPVYDEAFFDDDDYGPPPFAYGPPPFRPRPVFFGAGFGPGPFGPIRPGPFGWGGGWGGGPFF